MTKLLDQMREMDQSIWYDNIERKLLEDGTLAGKVRRGEIRGITSNPSIFNKAISQSNEYDSDIKKFTKQGLSNEAAYEKLAIQDIQTAADLFLPLYKESKGGDGFVSLEVSPNLAHDTEGTIKDAARIWKLVDRPNLMVKIPSTLEGLPAITETIASGINVNVTLIFSLDRYSQVRDAYLAGLEKRLSAGESLSMVASVASFFISRIDTKVDQKLEALLTSSSPQESDLIKGLLGKTAIASGKLAYADYEMAFGEKRARFKPLMEEGARRQRVLWASTSTKNPAYPDTKYVDDMIGPKTINTIPPHTLEAFLDHGVVERTIDRDLESAHQVIKDIAALGIDLEGVTDELEKEGVKAFADAYRSLLDSLGQRMSEFRD
jgi:transaldolase